MKRPEKCRACRQPLDESFYQCAFCHEAVCSYCVKDSKSSIVSYHFTPGSMRHYCLPCRDALRTNTPQTIGIDPQDPVLEKEYAAFLKEREIHAIAVALHLKYKEWKEAQRRYNTYAKSAIQDLAEIEREGVHAWFQKRWSGA